MGLDVLCAWLEVVLCVALGADGVADGETDFRSSSARASKSTIFGTSIESSLSNAVGPREELALGLAAVEEALAGVMVMLLVRLDLFGSLFSCIVLFISVLDERPPLFLRALFAVVERLLLVGECVSSLLLLSVDFVVVLEAGSAGLDWVEV